jgi:hypothetical protein
MPRNLSESAAWREIARRIETRYKRPSACTCDLCRGITIAMLGLCEHVDFIGVSPRTADRMYARLTATFRDPGVDGYWWGQERGNNARIIAAGLLAAMSERTR